MTVSVGGEEIRERRSSERDFGGVADKGGNWTGERVVAGSGGSGG